VAGFLSILAGAGNLPFLRAVHPYERAEMTTVFASFRDVAQLGPPVVCALLLSLFNLSAVFVAAGLMMLASSLLSRRIPRRPLTEHFPCPGCMAFLAQVRFRDSAPWS